MIVPSKTKMKHKVLFNEHLVPTICCLLILHVKLQIFYVSSVKDALYTSCKPLHAKHSTIHKENIQ